MEPVAAPQWAAEATSPKVRSASSASRSIDLPRHMTPPPPIGAPPPVPQSTTMLLDGRRPSNGSTRSGQSRAPSSSHAPINETSRRAHSQERRTPSLHSQVSHDSRREVTEQRPGTGNSHNPSPASSFHDNHTITKKKSSKDVASQMRLAANTYSVRPA